MVRLLLAMKLIDLQRVSDISRMLFHFGELNAKPYCFNSRRYCTVSCLRDDHGIPGIPWVVCLYMERSGEPCCEDFLGLGFSSMCIFHCRKTPRFQERQDLGTSPLSTVVSFTMQRKILLHYIKEFQMLSLFVCLSDVPLLLQSLLNSGLLLVIERVLIWMWMWISWL